MPGSGRKPLPSCGISCDVSRGLSGGRRLFAADHAAGFSIDAAAAPRTADLAHGKRLHAPLEHLAVDVAERDDANAGQPMQAVDV